MKREAYNFPVKVKRLVYSRAKGRCEGNGSSYGMAEGHRCPAFLSRANVHYGPDKNGDALAICPTCSMRVDGVI